VISCVEKDQSSHKYMVYMWIIQKCIVVEILATNTFLYDKKGRF